MLKQCKNIITLCDKPNRHLINWGLSGQGKTYFDTSMIEEEYKNGRSIAIIDYSGSYTQAELQKSNFKYVDELMVLNPAIAPISWNSNANDIDLFIQEAKDILVNTLDIKSYNQSSLLFQALESLESEYGKPVFSWNIPKLIKGLKSLKGIAEGESESPDVLPNIDRLLTRLMKFENLCNFDITFLPTETTQSNKRITIFQLSDLPEEHRFFLTKLLSELMWLETRRGKNSSNYYETIVFDEFQFLSINRGSALSHFIREGRKFGVGLVLSTQFISHYTEEEQETLLQAGNILIFKPTPRDLNFSAKVIDFNTPAAWKKILSKLPIGSAVLVGHYRINNNNTLLTKPIVCNITKEVKDDVKELARCTNSAGCSKSTTCKRKIGIFPPSPRGVTSQKSR